MSGLLHRGCRKNRSRHSWRICNPHFYVSGRKPTSPGSHWWGCYPGTLSWSEVSATYLPRSDTRRWKCCPGQLKTRLTTNGIFLHSGRRPTGAKRPSAGCPECICNRPRPWRRPCVSDWGCGAVILLSRGEFGREKNKICYQRGCVWTFCYMPNLWYNIVILQHIFILRNNRCERSYFVFNLGSFARNREWETQVCVFGVFFLNIC